VTSPIDVVDGVIQRDVFGIANGGIRLPEMEIPTQVTSGVGNTPLGFWSLFGTTTPLPVPSPCDPSEPRAVRLGMHRDDEHATRGRILGRPDAAQELASATSLPADRSAVSVDARWEREGSGVVLDARTRWCERAPDLRSVMRVELRRNNTHPDRTTGESVPRNNVTARRRVDACETYRCTVTAKNALGTSSPSFSGVGGFGPCG